MLQNNYDSGNGKLYYSPTRKQFIQVREAYFNLNKREKQPIHTGHWASYSGDAKNNIPFDSPQVTIDELRQCIDVEVEGLAHIPDLVYQEHNNEWVARTKADSCCPRCGHLLKSDCGY